MKRVTLRVLEAGWMEQHGLKSWDGRACGAFRE